MFCQTFRKLSQQFGASFFFIESSCAFLFKFFYLKVYIKPSRIWDTLPISKMGLYATIGLCKVIFCRFITLYTQYCHMSVVFVSALYWFHFVPGSSTCKHLAIANVVFYCLMLLHAQFLPTSFLFFASIRCSVYLVSSSLTLFRVVPFRFRQFQLVLAGSSQFQRISTCSSFQYVRYKTRAPSFSYF